jgi:4-coumarate--CoA ligase
LTTWEWLFESSEYSPLCNGTSKQLACYVDAVTKEKLNWAQVKAKSTALSTVLIKKYGLEPNDTVSLFSTNTIWYPVAMFAVIRAGMSNLGDISKAVLMLEKVGE